MSLLDNHLYNFARTFVLHVSSVLIIIMLFFEAKKGMLGRSVA